LALALRGTLDRVKQVNERTTSAAWVRSIAEALGAAGLDARGSCAEAGIDLAVLCDPLGRCATEHVSRLWLLGRTFGRPGDRVARRRDHAAVEVRCRGLRDDVERRRGH